MKETENEISLMDGRVIEAYPLDKEEPAVNNKLSLDTTGEYLVLSKKRKPLPLVDAEYREERRRREAEFYSNAWLFIAKADRILSDSRLFLTPVPMVNGLAYTGTSGFRRPTLGVYVEWWKLHYEASHTKNGAPLWYLAGSPLSGANSCAYVTKDGKSESINITHFSRAWHTFVAVNTRYDEAKTKYQAYTLQEAIKLLRASDDDDINKYVDRLLADKKRLEEEVTHLREVVYDKNETIRKAHDREIDLLVRLNYDAVGEALDEYRRLHLAHSRAKTAYYQKRNELRKSRKELGISFEQYTSLLPEMHADVEQALAALKSFGAQYVKKFKEAYGISSVTLDEIHKAYDFIKHSS